jgi:hypothetical protein
MNLLMDFAYFVFDAIAILLLVATWQRSRIRGFLVLAVSYALGIVARWGIALSYRYFDPGDTLGLSWVYQLVWLLVSAVALYGLWDLYRHFRHAGRVAPSAH